MGLMHFWTRWFAIVVLSLMGTANAQDANPASPAPAEPVVASVEEIQARIAALDKIDGLETATREAATALYREAIEALARRTDALGKTAEFDRLTVAAPALLSSIRMELASPPVPPVLDVPLEPTLTQLEQGLSQAQALLQSVRTESDELVVETSKRTERRGALADQLTDLRKRLDVAKDERAAIAPGDTTPLTEARRVMLNAKLAALSAEIKASESERTSYDARVELLPARRDRAVRRVAWAQATVDAWQALVTQSRQAEAKTAAREAERLEREAARQHAVLKQFADENTRLANLRIGVTGTAATLDTMASQLTKTRSALDALRNGYQSVQRRIRATALNRATGLLLRTQYAALREPSALRQELRATQRSLERIEFRRIELQEDREGAGDINKIVEQLIEQVNASVKADEADPVMLDSVARELATNRRDALDSLLVDASKQSQLLVDLISAQQTLLDATVAYRDYIEERILWIRSVSNDRVQFGSSLVRAVRWYFDPTEWGRAIQLGWKDTRSNPLAPVSVLALIVLSFFVRRMSRNRLYRVADLVRSYRTDSMLLTLKAVGYTVGASAFIPTIILTLVWLASGSPSQVPVVGALSVAIMQKALMIFVPFFAIASVCKRGLFVSHFRWPIPAVKHIRCQMYWYLPIVIPLILMGRALDSSGDEDMVASFGRLAFTVHMVALAFFVQRLLRPGGPAMSEYFARQHNRVIGSARYFWYVLAVTIPLIFIAMSWAGFHYTVTRLFVQVQQSLVLLFGLILAYGFMSRWLFVSRRQVASAAAKRKREKLDDETDGAVEGGGMVEESELDLPAISAQSQQIFRATIFVTAIIGTFSIWAPVLPALRMLDRIELWPSARIVSAAEDTGVPLLELQSVATPGNEVRRTSPGATTPPATDASGTSGTSASVSSSSSPIDLLSSPMGMSGTASKTEAGTDASSPLIVTVADVLLAIVVLIATWFAFRNFPGLLEIVVLPRLPLDAGSRYALSTVLRYMIAIIGFSIAFSVMGLSWNKVQWLAAALTFGLAFGLQEIFANFMSGLIILAERPVRIGDSVTVGGVTGDVSRIRMRATTIVDWDNKELIIPNKSFITGEVINWTLTNSVLRVIIGVGVSYSSDVDQVVRVLKKIALAEPGVLESPPSSVLFQRFGDSTLDFELRVFIPSVRHFVPVKHSLNMAIMKRFREEGIEIAFPQRDLHIRSAEAPIRIVKDDGSDVLTIDAGKAESSSQGDSSS